MPVATMFFGNPADCFFVSAALAAPAKLVVIPVSPTRIDLAWTDMDNEEDEFEIERSNDGTTGWTPLTTIGAGIASYADGGHAAGTTKHYRVRAYKTGYGDSAWSPVKHGVTTDRNFNSLCR